MKAFVFIFILGLLIGGSVIWNIKPDKVCPELQSQTIDTVEVPIIKDSISYYPKVVYKKGWVNVDSIWQAAKKYWEQIYDNSVPVDYVAVTDTNLNNDNISGSIAFRSRIPIDPEGYFSLDLKTKKEIITNNFVETKEIVYKDSWNIGFGAIGHFNDSVKVNLFGNLTYKLINLKHFEMPISAEFELDDNFRISDKKIIIGGKFKF